MKYFLSICLLLLVSNWAVAQNDVWTPYYADNQLVIDYKLTEDNRPQDGIYQKVYQLRYSNQTNKPIRVRYNRAVWYNNNCFGCAAAGDEYTQQIDLQPGEVLTKLPAERDDRFTIFYSSQVTDKVLTKFELQNLDINER